MDLCNPKLNRVFRIAPASAQVCVALTCIILFTLIPGISIVYSWYNKSVPVWACIVTVVILVGLDAVFLFFGYSARNGKFILRADGLRIRSAIYGRHIPADSIISKETRMVDLRNQKDFEPVIRTNGVGLPGYSAGWFRGRSKKKMLLFVTDISKVVYIPTKDGYGVMLSVDEPAEFVKAIHEL